MHGSPKSLSNRGQSLGYYDPLEGFPPFLMEQWSGRGWEGYHLETLPSNSSGQQRTASFIYQALQEVTGLCFLFPALLGFYNESLDTITKEQKCLWFDWQLTWQLFIHLNLKCILTKKSVFFHKKIRFMCIQAYGYFFIAFKICSN